MKRLMIGVLVALVVWVGEPAAAGGQTRRASPDKPAGARPSDAEKIRKKVEALGVGHRVTVVLRNSNEYYGALGRYDDDSLEIFEIDLNQKITVAYGDVKAVRSGFGNPNQFNGKRWRPGWHIAAIAIATGLMVSLIIIGATSSR